MLAQRQIGYSLLSDKLIEGVQRPSIADNFGLLQVAQVYKNYASENGNFDRNDLTGAFVKLGLNFADACHWADEIKGIEQERVESLYANVVMVRDL